MNDKNNNNQDDNFNDDHFEGDHFEGNNLEDEKYFREEERRKQENFEKYFGDVFNSTELEKGDERRYLEGSRRKNFFNSEEAKKMARILAEFGKEGYNAYYDFMMDQVYWLDEESSRKALRRMDLIREDIRQMETRYLKSKSYWFELDGNIIQLREEVRQGKISASDADRETKALQTEQERIKDDMTRMFEEFEGMEKEYHQFLDIVKTSLKEAIATSKEIREFREQSRDQHGSTLKHYYEMSNFKTGMLQNTSGIFNKMVSIKSLSVIMVCTILFGGAVGLSIGKFAFGDDLPKDVFKPDYISVRKPKLMMKLESQKQIDEIKPLLARDQNFAKVGNFVVFSGHQNDLHILKAGSFVRAIKVKSKIIQYEGHSFILTHKVYRSNQLCDKIETSMELDNYKKVADKFADPQRINIGAYVYKHSKEQIKKGLKYTYHILSPKDRTFQPYGETDTNVDA